MPTKPKSKSAGRLAGELRPAAVASPRPGPWTGRTACFPTIPRDMSKVFALRVEGTANELQHGEIVLVELFTEAPLLVVEQSDGTAEFERSSRVVASSSAGLGWSGPGPEEQPGTRVAGRE